MSIMKAILEAAAELSGVTDQELDDWHERATQETGDDDVRLIRERQLKSWTGSSTPISQQITNSEQHLDKLREIAMPAIKELLPRLFAIERKRYRIDKLKEEYATQRELARLKAGDQVHEDYVFFDRQLERLGAGPSKVRQLKGENRVIYADLARWKADDPLYENPDNPWIAVRAVYANRTIEKVGKNDKAGAMSVPGSPPPDRPEEWGTKYWRFGRGPTVQQPTLPTTSHPAEPDHTDDEPAPSRNSARSDIVAGTTPSETAPVEVEERADHLMSRLSAAASLAEGMARFQATGERWYWPQADRQATSVVALPAPLPDGETIPILGSGEEVRANSPASVPAPVTGAVPRQRRTINADQARDIAPRYVELERSWIHGFWPKSVPADERRKEILLPALEAEFGSFRHVEPFASWFRAVEANEASGFIEKRRDTEIANVIKMLMNGHSTIVARAERFGLLSAVEHDPDGPTTRDTSAPGSRP